MGQVAATATLSPSEQLVIQAITDGTYFVDNVVPSGTIDGSNAIFTLPSAPFPTSSLVIELNGAKQTVTTDFTLSGSTVTFVNAPDSGSVLTASFRVSPV